MLFQVAFDLVLDQVGGDGVKHRAEHEVANARSARRIHHGEAHGPFGNVQGRADMVEARDAAHVFRKRVECEAVLITRGEQGMWLSDRDGDGAVPAVTREVSDVTGAGDTVVATLSLALAAGATLAEAAVLANHAAGIVVGKFGPATLTRAELLSSFPTTR